MASDAGRPFTPASAHLAAGSEQQYSHAMGAALCSALCNGKNTTMMANKVL